MSRHVGIETEVGTIHGRDAIYLDRVVYELPRVEFVGELNTKLCANYRGDVQWLGYCLEFAGVLVAECRELDVSGWEETMVTSFDEIIGADCFAGIDCPKDHRAFSLGTYDYIFRIVATSYRFDIDRTPSR